LSPAELSGWVAGEGGAEMIQSQGLGTRGLSESDSPNILRTVDVDKGGILPYIRGIIVSKEPTFSSNLLERHAF
jgi:hypothetical protein